MNGSVKKHLNYTLHTVHWSIYSTYYTQNSKHYPLGKTLILHTTHYTLHTLHYTLQTTHYTLHTKHYTLHVHLGGMITAKQRTENRGKRTDNRGNRTEDRGQRISSWFDSYPLNNWVSYITDVHLRTFWRSHSDTSWEFTREIKKEKLEF